MSDVANLLRESRAAHQQAKRGDRSLFQVALDKRLEARAADPTRTDPAWLDDAQHPAILGETQRRYHRVPGKTPAQVAADKDAELEAYFRSQLEPALATPQVDLTPDEIAAKVIIPKAWRITKLCAQVCACKGHKWQLLTFTTRTCIACSCQQELFETTVLEETLAFKQLTKEQQRDISR